MTFVPRLNTEPLSNTIGQPPILASFSTKQETAPYKFDTFLPITIHQFDYINSNPTHSIFNISRKTETALFFRFLFNNEHPLTRANLLPWEGLGILGEYYAISKLLLYKSAPHLEEAWLKQIIKFNECRYNKKSCPRVLTGVTILSWTLGHAVLFPELMCLLNR